MGKSSWARSLGEHVYWNIMANVKTAKLDAPLLIIDDFPVMPSWWKAAIGGQEEWTLTDKYCSKRDVFGPKVVIFLFNNMPDWLWDVDYINDNSLIYNVYNKLF